jgi:cysteine desulfurase
MADERIYLDNAATTRPLDAVIERMAQLQREHFGNPSSAHFGGEEPRRQLEDAREFLRGSLGAGSIVFTSGGTESDLLGVFGAALARPPGRVLVGASDHPAVLEQATLLGSRSYPMTEVPVSAHGDIEPEALFEVLGTDVRVVSILHGHNELGTLADLAELTSLVRRVCEDAHVHVDLVQSYGKIDFDLDLAGVDSVAVSAHKLHGPRGVGFLALSTTARIAPLMHGGGQEGGLRGGTENVAGAVGMAVAAEHMLSHLAEHGRHMESLAADTFEHIHDRFPDAIRLGHPSRRLPHVLSVRIPGVVGQTLQQCVDARGVAISTGSACHAKDGDERTNPVLAAIGLDRGRAREVVRISFASDTARAAAERAAQIVCEEAARLRELSPRRRNRADSEHRD